MSSARSHDLQALAGRVEEILDAFRDGDAATGERAEELVRALVGMYGVGLERVLELLDERDRTPNDADESLVRLLAADDVVGRLLILHDLHPDDVDTRIQHALDGVRPYLGSHAGGIHYDGVDAEGAVRLRLEGSCDGCPSSAVTVKLTVERAIQEAAPEVEAIEVEGMVSDEPPLLQIQPRPDDLPPLVDDGWVHLEVGAAPGEVVRQEVAGLPLAICDLDGTPYAYRDRCPGCSEPISIGLLIGDLLSCPTCGSVYNVRLAGRADQAEGDHLEPVPILPDGAGWKVAVSGGVSA